MRKPLRIRREQMQAFEQHAGDAFAEELAQHLHEFAPTHCEALGIPAVHQIVRLGMDKAAVHGFTLRGPIRFYLECMVMFGTEFDTDPALPWVGEILSSRADDGEMFCAERLYSEVRKYVQAVFGPRSAYAWRAIHAASAARAEAFPDLGPGFQSAILARLHAIYPEKCAYVGATALLALLERAQREAQSRSMDSSLGRSMFVILMFMLGHGCLTDPQYPWVAAGLRPPAPGEHDIRTERLRMRGIQFLDLVLTQEPES